MGDKEEYLEVEHLDDEREDECNKPSSWAQKLIKNITISH